MTLGISESVWSFSPGDKGGLGLMGVFWGVEISYPLVFVGRPGGTKILEMLAISNLGM